MSDPFRVGVADLLRTPGTRRTVRRCGSLGRLVVADVVVDAAESVCVEATLEATGGTAVVAAGTVEARWTGPCRRCLQPVTGMLEADFQELYELHPTEGESYRLQGDQVDLGELAREAVLLGLPLAPLCSDACAGLCPTCGRDRNQGPCGCEAPVDPRWAALDGLVIDERADPPGGAPDAAAGDPPPGGQAR